MNKLKQKHIWLAYKDKQPFSVITGKPTGTNSRHKDEWVNYLEAKLCLDSKSLVDRSEVLTDETNAPTTATVPTPTTANESTTAETAVTTTTNKTSSDSSTGAYAWDGIGFVIPRGYFFVDVDHKELDDPLVKELLALFPTYAEVSPSGKGIHFYGKCDLTLIPTETVTSLIRLSSKEEKADGTATPPRKRLSRRYYSKNSVAGLEVYIGGLTSRYSTFTGNKVPGTPEEAVDCSKSLLIFLEMYMKRNTAVNDGAVGAAEGAGVAATDSEEAEDDASREAAFQELLNSDKWMRLTEAEIDEAVEDLRTFENGAKFISLYDRGEYPEGKSHSEADITLCAMIAFRVGPDPDMIDRIFRESRLYRDKWEREDYAERTIAAAIEACHGNFYHGIRQRPPFVSVSEKGKESVVATKLASYIRKNLNYYLVRHAASNDPQIFIYRDDVYKMYSKQLFEGAMNSFIESYDPDLIRMGTTDEALRILLASEVFLTMDDMNRNELLINVKNGFLDIGTLQLRPHTPKVFSTIKLDVEWGPLQQAGILEPTPVFDAFMDNLAGGAEDVKKFLLQYMGAIFSNVNGRVFKKALFLKGIGNSGKSQIKALTENLLGEENYAIIDLAQLEERFGTSSLYGKRLAGASDLRFMSIPELKTFKEVTGGDFIRGEFKGKDAFRFQYKGFFWFCMNALPRFGGDLGKWVYERIIIIPCDHEVPPEKRDKKIIDKLMAERNGIFQKAILAFKEVVENGYNFDEPACVAKEREAYKIENSPSIEFFTTQMEERQGDVKRTDVSRVDSIYSVYREWYKAQGYNMNFIRSKKDFFKEIADFVGVSYEDMKKRTHSGISLKAYVLTEDALRRFGYILPTDEEGGLPPLATTTQASTPTSQASSATSQADG